VVGADLENVQTGRRDASQIVRILVKVEKFLRGGGDQAGAGENRHAQWVEGSLAGGAAFSLLQ
jgi:hypothetical protein